MRKIYIVLLLVVSILSCAKAKHVESPKDDVEILKSNLGSSFSISDEKQSVVYKYCPDNTCTIFTSNKDNVSNLNRFTLLYLYYASGYVYLVLEKDNFIKNSQSHVKKIISQEVVCQGDELQVASCIMSRLIDTKIRGYSVRFDENIKTKTIIDLEKRIEKNNLIQISKWREGIGKNKKK